MPGGGTTPVHWRTAPSGERRPAQASAEFRRAHSTKRHSGCASNPTPIRPDTLGPLAGLPARTHDVVRRSLVHVGRASGAAETHEDCNCCEDVTHPFKYAPGPWATIRCARISPLSTGSCLAPITETWGPGRYRAASVSCRSHTHGCRDRPEGPGGLRGNAWLAGNPSTRGE